MTTAFIKMTQKVTFVLESDDLHSLFPLMENLGIQPWTREPRASFSLPTAGEGRYGFSLGASLRV